MNIQAHQASIAAAGTGRIGGYLDIKSDAPAPSHGAAPAVDSASRTATGLEGAGLLDLLDPQEQQALTAAFAQTKTPVYSGRGTTNPESPMLGTQLDLKA